MKVLLGLVLWATLFSSVALAEKSALDILRDINAQMDAIRAKHESQCNPIRPKPWLEGDLGYDELMVLWENINNEIRRNRVDCLDRILRFESDLVYRRLLMLAQHEYRSGQPFSSVEEAQGALFDEPLFEANADGVQRTAREFTNKNLALLYLKAVEEQYSVLNVNVVGSIGENFKGYPLHDGRHLFDDHALKARGQQKSYTAILRIVPDLQHDQKVAIEKIQLARHLEGLRHKILMAAIAATRSGADFMKDPEVQALLGEFNHVIESFRGNSVASREDFLNNLAQSSQFNEDVRRVAEELEFQRRWTEAVAGVNPMNVQQARMFFYLLGNYFKNAFSEDYVIWPKLFFGETKSIAGENYVISGHGIVQIRFYISKTQAFIENVFTDEIPIRAVQAWYVLKRNSTEDLPWASQMLNQFVSANSYLFNKKARDRLNVVSTSLLSQSYHAGRWSPDHHQPKFKSRFKATLENGQVLTENDVFVLRPLSSNGHPIGIVNIEIEHRGRKTVVDIDKATGRITQRSPGVISSGVIHRPGLLKQYASEEFESTVGNLRLYSQYGLPIIRAINMEIE